MSSIGDSDKKKNDGPVHASGKKVLVLLPLPFNRAFVYRVPENLTLFDGSFVKVYFGTRQIIGVVWGANKINIAEDKIKDITDKVDFRVLPEVARLFIDWVSAYTLQPKGLVLKMSMSVPAALEVK